MFLERWTIPLEELPLLFSRAEYYIDLRKRVGANDVVKCVGKAALEALACGCRVVDWAGKVHDQLMVEHSPENVAERWHKLYLGLLHKDGLSRKQLPPPGPSG